MSQTKCSRFFSSDAGSASAGSRLSCGVYRDRPSGFHVDGSDGTQAVDLRSGGSRPLYERCGQLSCTTYRNGEAAVLGHHDQQIAHHAAARGVDGDVGVHRIAKQE